MRFAIALALVTGGLTATTHAQAQDPHLPRVAPETVGMSAEHLARFDTLATEYAENGRVPGVVALVLRDGKMVYEGVTGVQDVDTGLPLQGNSIFRIASQTKLIVSVATMMLLEEGRLQLDEPVADFIPEFAETTLAVRDGDSVRVVPANRQITIHDLLTHTSGIPDSEPELLADQYAAASLTQGKSLINYLDEPISSLASRLAALPFSAQPGQRFIYGYSTDVLGAVLERASGVPLDDLLRTRIFMPLGMLDTHFFLPQEKLDRLVANHFRGDDGVLVRGSDDDLSWDGQGAFVRGPRRLFQGSGGLLSTAYDYARFLQMLLNDGEMDGVRILSPASVRQITINHVGDLYSRSLEYPGMGFGFNVEVKLDPAVGGFDVPPLASPGSFGWGGAAYTTFWVDPTERIIGVFMSQLRPPNGDLHRKFGNIVYGAIVSSRR